jgi:hypothetical protein
MNFNIVSYLIYLSITTFIILVVGRICYRNGNVFVAQLIPNHIDLCQKVNQVLLMAYYLLNIGYCAMTLIQWKTIETVPEIVETIASKTSIIVLMISILHYINIFIITKYIQKLIH